MNIVTLPRNNSSNRFVWFSFLILAFLYFYTRHQKRVEKDEKENRLDVKGLMVPPSDRNIPYNLANKTRVNFSQFKQDELVAKVFNNKVNGFFVEAGAYNGETNSNTLYLERTLNWTGLLIEPVPNTYQILAKKRRKAHIINACISPDGKQEILPIISYFGGGKENSASAQIEGGPKMDVLDSFAKKVESGGYKKLVKITYKIPCFPLETMLDAIGNPVIDYFSLDVEGFDMKVLKSIPWDKIKIKFIGIEATHVPEGKEAVKTFMEKQGYKFFKKVHIDYFFYKPDLFTDINLSQQDQLHS